MCVTGIFDMMSNLTVSLRRLKIEQSRLANVNCPTMSVGTGIDDAPDAMRDELDELEAEVQGSDKAKAEVSDIVSIAVRMCELHGIEVGDAIDMAYDKIKRRLDCMVSKKITWSQAKKVVG